MGFFRKLEDKIKDLGRKIDDELLQPVKNTVEAIIEDPKKLAAVALSVAFPGAGAALGGMLGLGAGATAQIVGQTLINTALNGGDLKSAVVSAATPLMGRAGVNIVAENLAKSGIDATLNKIISNAVVSGGTAAAFGQDPKAAFLFGGSSAAVNLLTPKIPGFDDLPDVAKNATKAALIAELNKGDGSDAALNAAVNTGIKLANDYIRDSTGITGAIPSGLVRVGSQQPGPRPGQPPEQAPSQPSAQQETAPQPPGTPEEALEQAGLDMGPQTRSLSDLSAEELADLLAGGATPEPTVTQTEEVNPYAEVIPTDLGFGSVDYGGKDFGAKEDLSFGRAFALARASGEKTFDWQGKPYTTELAKDTSVSAKAPSYDSIGGGRGGQGGPTAEELARYVAKGSSDPTAAELAAASKPYVGYPGFSMDPKMGDINQVADPRTLAFVSGVLGQAPDEQGFSALHPDIEDIRRAGGAGYYTGVGAQVAAPLAKGISSLGGGIKSLLGESGASQNPALANFLKESAVKDRLYHGTADDITEFMGGKNKSSTDSLAGWLAGDPAYASQYAAGKANASLGLNARPGANVMPVYANMRNPMNLDDPKVLETIKTELPYMRIPPENLRYTMTEGGQGDALVDLARRLGYDAFQTLDEGFMTYAPFSGGQIKSAIGNIGTYNPRDMRLGYAEGGMAEAAPEMSTDELIELLMNMRQN